MGHIRKESCGEMVLNDEMIKTVMMMMRRRRRRRKRILMTTTT